MSLNRVTFLFISIQCFIVVSGGVIGGNLIDTGCHSDVDCKEFEKMNQVVNTTCFNHQCICKDSDFKTIQCLPQKQGLANIIGGKCPCSNIKDSSCIDGFCMCKMNYTTSEDKRSCIPKKVPIGSRCENNVQCSKETTFSICVNNTCACKSEFVLLNGTCHSLVDLGQGCGSDVKCIPNTICDHKCVCEPGYVAKFDKTACLPNVGFNDGCLESVQCQHNLGAGGVCEHGKCVCGEDFSKISFQVANDTKIVCENRIVIGQMCAYDTDCYQSHFNGTEQSMYCYLKECQCAPEYELDRNQEFCIKSKNTELQSTWFDSLLSKVSSTFSSSSSGHRNKSICYLVIIISIVSVISHVLIF